MIKFETVFSVKLFFFLLLMAFSCRSTTIQKEAPSSSSESLSSVNDSSASGSSSSWVSSFYTGNTNTLRDLAAAKPLLMGAAVNATVLQQTTSNADLYRQVLAREYNLVTHENAMKMEPVQPEQDVFDFSDVDAVLAFAQSNNMKARGHTLVWAQQIPDWFKNGSFTSNEMEQIMSNHITTVIKHCEDNYPGTVVCYDVVNEAYDMNGNLQNPPYYDAFGSNYIHKAFAYARAAAPANVKLFYNDFSFWDADKRLKVATLLSNLVNDGVPIDGLGVQFHIKTWTGLDDYFAVIDAAIGLGLEVQVTECDIPLQNDQGSDTGALETQAQKYYDLLGMCLARPEVTAFVTWGFTDKYSWVPMFMSGYDHALPFNKNYEAKPAYYALQKALSE